MDGRPSLLRALRHRNYRLFFAGQSPLLSAPGHARRDGLAGLSPHRLGAAARPRRVLRADPDFVLAPVAGVFVDRWDRHRVLVVTQALSMSSLALAVLARPADHVANVPALASSGPDQRLRHARAAGVRRRWSGPRRPPNAIALNSSMVNQLDHGAVDRRGADRGGGGGMVLSAGCDPLRRGDRVASRDARPRVNAPRRARPGAGGAAGGLPMRGFAPIGTLCCSWRS